MTARSILTGIGLAALVVFGWVLLRPSSDGPARADSDSLEALWEAPDFELTSSAGESVSKNDLLGKVWVVDFIFTRCPGPCPRMSREMKALQDAVPAGEPVRFVSITIDPQYDTPEVLAAYAKHYGADRSRWIFLTGDTVKLAVKGFFTAVDRNQADEITHGTHFLLVGRQGKVRGVYDIGEEGFRREILADIERLTNVQ